MRRVEGEKWREEVVGKAAGDERVFIAGRGSGWQMKPVQTPYRTRRAVREVTGPLNRMAYRNSQVPRKPIVRVQSDMTN